jgi:ion channel
MRAFLRRGERLGRRHRYGIVLLSAVVLAVFSLTAPDNGPDRVLTFVGAAVTLLIAVVTSRAPARTRRAVAIAIGAMVAVGTITALVAKPEPAGVLGAAAVLSGATIGVISGGLFRLIVERGVVVQAVLGALAVYLLIGLTLAFVVGALDEGLHAPYFAQGPDIVQSRRTYFSFTVLTTTGFGDLTPAQGIGRLLAVLEMLLGQLYLVTVIALLVGNLGRGRDRGHEAEGLPRR